MKILFVDQTAQLGGAELWLRDVVLGRGACDSVYLFQNGPLADSLQQHQVQVQTFEAPGHVAELRKNSGLMVKLRSVGAVTRLVRSVAQAARQADVIYANTPKALVVGALAGKLARKPVVYHLHDILSREHFSRSNLALLVGCANRLVNHVVANSQATLAAYRAAGGSNDCSVSYNGFDCTSFQRYIDNQATHAAGIRRQLQLPDRAPLLAVFGRLAPWKGQHTAIEALHDLPNVHLMLVGDALFGEQDYKERLHNQAGHPDLAGRVHFMGFQADVFPLMQAANIVIHCSVAPEPFGRVIVEAMLSKRPIIAANAGGAQEILDSDDDTGFLFEPGNQQSLVDQIRHVLGLTAAERLQILENAHASAAKRFDLKSAVDAVTSVVEKLAR